MKNIMKRCTISIIFPLRGKQERKTRILLDHSKKGKELLKLESSVGIKPNGHEWAMNKFSLEIRSRFINIRGVRFLNGFPIESNRSKSHLRQIDKLTKGILQHNFLQLQKLCTPWLRRSLSLAHLILCWAKTGKVNKIQLETRHIKTGILAGQLE